MSKKQSSQADQKQVASLLGRQFMDQSEWCITCGTETDISSMNIVTEECSACSRTSINKLKELLATGSKCD